MAEAVVSGAGPQGSARPTAPWTGSTARASSPAESWPGTHLPLLAQPRAGSHLASLWLPEVARGLSHLRAPSELAGRLAAGGRGGGGRYVHLDSERLGQWPEDSPGQPPIHRGWWRWVHCRAPSAAPTPVQALGHPSGPACSPWCRRQLTLGLCWGRRPWRPAPGHWAGNSCVPSVLTSGPDGSQAASRLRERVRLEQSLGWGGASCPDGGQAEGADGACGRGRARGGGGTSSPGKPELRLLCGALHPTTPTRLPFSGPAGGGVGAPPPAGGPAGPAWPLEKLKGLPPSGTSWQPLPFVQPLIRCTRMCTRAHAHTHPAHGTLQRCLAGHEVGTLLTGQGWGWGCLLPETR